MVTLEVTIDGLLASALRGQVEPWPDNLRSDDAIAQACSRAEFHGLAPLLAKLRLTESGWPAALIEHLHAASIKTSLWEVSHRDVLCHLLDGLAARGVEAIVLKGTALAYAYYNAPESRPRGDTDLLVRPLDLQTTREVLEQSGLVRKYAKHGTHYQEAWVLAGSDPFGHVIDLHWRTLDAPRLQMVLLDEEVFANRRALSALSPHAAMPGLHAMILHGLINQEWHGNLGVFVDGERIVGGTRLGWVMDNHLLFDAVGPDEWIGLADLARERGIAPLLAKAMREVEAVFGVMPHKALCQQLEASPKSTPITRYCAAQARSSRLWSDLLATRGLAAKARFAWYELVPSDDHVRAIYPQATGWPTALLRMRRIVSRSIGAAVRRGS